MSASEGSGSEEGPPRSLRSLSSKAASELRRHAQARAGTRRQRELMRCGFERLECVA